MVLFVLPSADAQPEVEVGLVLSVWRGVKQPRLFSSASHTSSVAAFRVVALSMTDQDCKTVG